MPHYAQYLLYFPKEFLDVLAKFLRKKSCWVLYWYLRSFFHFPLLFPSSILIFGKEANNFNVRNLESKYERDKLRFFLGENIRLILLFLFELFGMSL